MSSSLSTAPTAPAMVISRPSSTQAMPSAMTILVWNGAQDSRSIRAGIRLRTEGPEAWEIATVFLPDFEKAFTHSLEKLASTCSSISLTTHRDSAETTRNEDVKCQSEVGRKIV